jgi:signal transduction histidine kinase
VYRYEWFHLAGRPGERERIGLVLRNMTDDSRLQEQLIQAEKSGSLGTLTAGIGHELNNPLFGILGLGEAIQDESDLSRAKTLAKDILSHGRRMASIIRDFTGVAAREATDQRTLVDVNVQVEQALTSVLQSFPATTLTVEQDYRATGRVQALPEELRRIFSNVLTNAVQAMGQQGSLLVRSEDHRGTVLVTIRDSGPGIPKHHLSKVFDPFFTTRGQGEGSGLGLTIARRLVQKYNGGIRLESQEGQGTTCLITFPIVESGVRKEAPVRS